MRQFIAYLLILSVLATNVAWAMDDCSSQYSNEVSALALSSDLSSNSQSDGVCDDACVGWLHLVGITPGTKLDCFSLTRQDEVQIKTPFHSLDQAPPIRPPQI